MFDDADTIDSAIAPFLYQEGWSLFVLFLLKTVKLNSVPKLTSRPFLSPLSLLYGHFVVILQTKKVMKCTSLGKI